MVGLLDHQLQFTRGDQRVRLTQIAAEAGGEAFFPHVMKEVEEAYAKILAQIRAQYVIGYISSNTKADGTWRKVEIKVKRSDVRGPRAERIGPRLSRRCVSRESLAVPLSRLWR